MSDRQWSLYLDDIKLAIKNINKYIKGMRFNDFVKDSKTQDAVVRNLEVIGEAAKHIPQSITKKFPGIPWAQVISMRNKMIHAYFGIDPDIVWQTIKEDLPQLQKQINKIEY